MKTTTLLLLLALCGCSSTNKSDWKWRLSLRSSPATTETPVSAALVAPTPVLSISKDGWLSWTAQPGFVYDVQATRCLSKDFSTVKTVTNGPVQIRTVVDAYHRLKLHKPGEVELLGGTECVQRNVATRDDGTMAYGYPAEGYWRVVAVPEVDNAVILADLPLGYFGMGGDCVWVGDKLYVLGVMAGRMTVWRLDVAADLTASFVEVFHYDDPTSSLRWPGMCVLDTGEIACTAYLQVSTGLKALLAFKDRTGNWTAQVSDLMGYNLSTQTAGNCLPIQHPEDGSLWVIGVKDSWGVLTAAKYCLAPAPSNPLAPPLPPQLQFVTNVLIVTQWPHNGVVDPCAIDGELPMNFRVVQDEDSLRVLANAWPFIVLHVPEFLKLDQLVSFTFNSVGNKSAPTYTTHYTERVIPDYAWVENKAYIVPISTDTTSWPKPHEQALYRDNGELIAELGYWTPIAQGKRCLVYQKRDGTLVLNRL